MLRLPASKSKRHVRCAKVMCRRRLIGSSRVTTSAIVGLVRAELDVLGEGRLAVIAPDAVASLGSRTQLAAALGRRRGGRHGRTRCAGRRARGEPGQGVRVRRRRAGRAGAILAASARGANDLYVALTRPTQRLRVVHSEPLPAGLESLGEP